MNSEKSSLNQEPAGDRRWKWKRLILRSLAFTFLVLLLAAGWGYWLLRSSLPQLDGELSLAGLTADVTVVRDANGIPSIVAKTREDAAQALGLLHGQDRFFQMDLLRRVSSGRLCGLIGAAPFPVDSAMRLHRFKEMVEKAVEDMPEVHRAVLEAYARGVNQGLASLRSSPPEYLLLRQTPEPWQINDSLFVVLSMVHQLEPLDGDAKVAWTLLRDQVPSEVFDFLVRKGSPWDAPLDDSSFPSPPIPPAEVWSLRDIQNVSERKAADKRQLLQLPLSLASWRSSDPELTAGSNAWAISAEVSATGRAILANDMHLGLRVPATWYRAAIEFPAADGETRRLLGATLPGLPLLVAGSNGSVAWGVTSSESVSGDLVELQSVDGHSTQYMTPDGPIELESFKDEILIAGGATKEIEFKWSKWGPVVAEQDGKRYAYRCVLHDSRSVDLGMIDLENSATVESAMLVANRSGGPRLNFIAADADGKIGWTLAGRLPKRLAASSPTAVDWSVHDQNWSELLPPEDYPRVLNPANGRVWNANDRSLGQDYLDLMGYGALGFGARSKQIRDRLFSQDKIDEAGMLAIQLDHEAIYLETWRQFMLEVAKLDPAAMSQECIQAIDQWSGKAAADSVGYRVVATFRHKVFDSMFGFVADDQPNPANSLADKLQLSVKWVQVSWDDVIFDLLDARPLHWLPSRFNSWDELLADAARATEQELTADQPLSEATWGQVTTTSIQHPLSQAVPWLSSWLDMPVLPLPGDRNMPRVQGATFGASERLVVSPGHEDQGIYHQPGGASGHFMSPFYRSGFDDWAEGTESPLLPGKAVHKLRLLPSAKSTESS